MFTVELLRLVYEMAAMAEQLRPVVDPDDEVDRATRGELLHALHQGAQSSDD